MDHSRASRPPAARSTPGRPSRAGDQAERLSRFLALVLRHKPETIGITLDSAGFVEVEMLAKAIADQPAWQWVTAEAIRTAAQQDARRYEISADRIRARYGHSIPIETPGRSIVPPEWLYHGTSPDALEVIHREGLRPQGRQFVHLSATRQDALTVGARHSSAPVAITILARRANAEGIAFYQAAPSIFLVREVPPQYLLLPENDE